MKKIASLAVALATLFIIPATAFAGSPGQLAGGDNYQVKNLTQNGSYATSASATCNDEVKYSMQLSNVEFGGLNNVTLKVTFPSAGGTSTATATTDLGGTSGTTDSASVTLGANQTISYENGTTMLYDDSGNAIKTLPDTITSSGVNIGTLAGSTTEFVNFKAKVKCSAPTPVCTDTHATNNGGALPCTYPQPKPTPTPAPAPKPAALPNTGPGEVAELFVGTSALGAAAHAVTRRFRR